MLVGRVSPPLPDTDLPWQLSFERLASGPRLIEIVTRPGGLLVRRLAADLADMGFEVAWVRPLPFEVETSSLGALLLKALAASRRSTSPGREPLVVVESPTAAQAETLVGQLLGPDAYGAFTPNVVLVMDAQGGMSASVSNSVQLQVPSLSPRLAGDLVSTQDARAVPLRQLCRTAGGLAGLIDGALRSLPQLGTTELADTVTKTRGPAALSRELASRILSDAPAETLAALEMSSRLGYAHGRLRALEPAVVRSATDPWWVPLTADWLQVNPVWQDALLAGPVRAPGLERSACLSRLVPDLVDEDAVHEAIELCIGAGWHGLAADLLAGEAERLESAGRHATLIGWLVRLSADETRSHSGLNTLALEGQRAARSEVRAEVGQLVPVAPVTSAPRRPHRLFRGFGGAQADPVRPLVRPPPGRSSPTAISESAAVRAEPPILTRPDPDNGLRLEARLLGSFELSIDGQPVVQWRGNRGRLLLAYLLLHRARPVHRDALGGVFWPEATPDVARNRLHVALHGLRRDLRTVSQQPIVVHSRSGFTFDSGVALWIDTEAFTTAVRSARSDEVGRPEAALGCYEAALDLYHGDLLEDAPYEDWALLDREQLRLQCLETLDRIAKMRFELGRYEACIDACQRLATGYPCREDIHRMLMRCYARLNKPHLAAHQYRQCERQLRDETGLKPAAATQNLYEQIRRRQLV
jgi:DNA-binding SARP family transcriptional activator